MFAREVRAMNVREALEAVIRYEMKVRDAYREASEKSPYESTREILRDMAKERHEHLDAVRKTYDRLQKSGKLAKFESAQASVAAAVDQEFAKFHAKMKPFPTISGGAELVRAMGQAELETHQYYVRVEKDLLGNQKTFFEQFRVRHEELLKKLKAELVGFKSGVSFPPK